MGDTAKLLALIIGGLVICIMAMMIIAGFFYPGGFAVLGIVPDSTYSYDVGIKASSEISNLTLFLPIPSYNEDSLVGVSIIDKNGYGPENLKYELFGAKESVMLKVSAETLENAIFGGVAGAGSLIDTREPLKNSAILSPVNSLSTGMDSAVYDTYTYAKYDAREDAIVEIIISAKGENKWSFLTSKSNSYTNTVKLMLKGPQSGWQTAGADLKYSIGDYTITL